MSKIRKMLEGQWSFITRAHSGEEIAKSIGTTRQNASNTLKRSMAKAYDETSRLHPEYSPFEVAQEMMEMFNVDDDDVANFFNLFPESYRDKIKADAAKRLPSSRRTAAVAPQKKSGAGIKFPKLPADKIRAMQVLYHLFSQYDEEDIPEIPNEYMTFLAKLGIEADNNDEIADQLKKRIDRLS
jgi:hypothetical protein